jgi:hypothetical protein
MQLIKGSKPLNNRFTVAKLVDVFFVLVSWRLKIVHLWITRSNSSQLLVNDFFK